MPTFSYNEAALTLPPTVERRCPECPVGGLGRCVAWPIHTLPSSAAPSVKARLIHETLPNHLLLQMALLLQFEEAGGRVLLCRQDGEASEAPLELRTATKAVWRRVLSKDKFRTFIPKSSAHCHETEALCPSGRNRVSPRCLCVSAAHTRQPARNLRV